MSRWIVEWRSDTSSHWREYPERFFFLRSARKLVGRRVVEPGSARSWRILDKYYRVVMEVERSSRLYTKEPTDWTEEEHRDAPHVVTW